MDQIIDAFGIDIRLIVIQLVNFGILLAALTYFLYKPVMGMLDAREQKIAKGIKDAEVAAVTRASAESDKQAVLVTAQAEAAGIAERARTHAEVVGAEVMSEAHAKAQAIVVEAEARAQESKRKAEKESEPEITKLAILATEKLLRAEA
jgi:F-type H+-transporting ATPase subunit b